VIRQLSRVMRFLSAGVDPVKRRQMRKRASRLALTKPWPGESATAEDVARTIPTFLAPARGAIPLPPNAVDPDGLGEQLAGSNH
jgi:hypothetical protein